MCSRRPWFLFTHIHTHIHFFFASHRSARMYVYACTDLHSSLCTCSFFPLRMYICIFVCIYVSYTLARLFMHLLMHKFLPHLRIMYLHERVYMFMYRLASLFMYMLKQ